MDYDELGKAHRDLGGSPLDRNNVVRNMGGEMSLEKAIWEWT
jgi:hypothetical protein